jgi:cytochrome P450
MAALDVDVIKARPKELDDSFAGLIEALPEGLVSAADDPFMDDALSRDPYTPLLELRSRCGHVVAGDNGLYGGTVRIPNSFARDLTEPHYVILGVEELDAISLNPGAFINDGAYGSHAATLGRIPTLTDGQEHTELRTAYNQALNHRAMAERAETLVKPIVHYLLDRMEAKFARGEAVDIPRDLALPLTYKAMSTMIGVPQSRFTDFVRLGELLFTAPMRPKEGAQASEDLLNFYLEEAAKRKIEPQADMITWLQDADFKGRRFTPVEVAQHARFLLPAGIETTWRQLALLFVAMLSHPEQYAEVVADPSLVPGALEETMRYFPSGFIIPRLCARTTTVGGVEIPAGATITMLEGIANRDPRRWENPEVFDIHRPLKTHRNFNIGVHNCAGQHLARLEMDTVLRGVTERFPTLKLACDPADLEIRGFQVRTPMRVPVALG